MKNQINSQKKLKYLAFARPLDRLGQRFAGPFEVGHPAPICFTHRYFAMQSSTCTGTRKFRRLPRAHKLGSAASNLKPHLRNCAAHRSCHPMPCTPPNKVRSFLSSGDIALAVEQSHLPAIY